MFVKTTPKRMLFPVREYMFYYYVSQKIQYIYFHMDYDILKADIYQ